MAKQMFRQTLRVTLVFGVAFAMVTGANAFQAGRQARPAATQAQVQKNDEEYAKAVSELKEGLKNG